MAEAATNYSGQTTRRESRAAELNAAMRLRPPSAGVRPEIASFSAPGSRLVLDYMDQEVIDRTTSFRGARRAAATEPARRYRPPASVWCETDDFMGIVSAERTTLCGSSGQPVDKP